MRNPARAIALLAIVVAVTACTGSPSPSGDPGAGSKGTIVVGVSGAFAENQLVAEMYAQVLERRGYTVDRELELRSRELSQHALESGQIDLKPEYLSSLLSFAEPNAHPSNRTETVVRELREVLAPRGVVVLAPSRAQDTNRFVANAETARRFGLTTMSSLSAVADQLTFGGPPECPQRPFCLAGLRDTYGILFDDFVPLDVGGPQTVEALLRDDVQIGLLFSTDPSIAANGFVPLTDDKYLQNAENITPVVREDALDDDVRAALDSVSAELTDEIVTALVGKVVIDGRDVPSVAREFLDLAGLV